jgi:hypothetical protein
MQPPPTGAYTRYNSRYDCPEPETIFADFAGPMDWTEQDKIVSKPMKSSASPGGIWTTEAKAGSASDRRGKTLLLGFAVLVMFLLLLIPTWDALGLVQDPVFMYMVGPATAGWLLACCIMLFLISAIVLSVFLDRLREELKTEQTFLMISGIFLSTLGIMLILFAYPLSYQAMHASKEFWNHCKSGQMTQPLFQVQEELKSLRAMPNCAALASIEDCVGFPAYPQQSEAMVLKAMETQFQCTGICQGTSDQGLQIYPPTLFSTANYTLSCDGMVARHILNFDLNLCYQLVAEGCMLVGTAIVISFGQLLAYCTTGGRKQESISGKSYGAIL